LNVSLFAYTMSADSTVSIVGDQQTCIAVVYFSIILLFKGFLALTVLLLSYLVQKYLPPPVPRIVGFDLGTTYSSAAVYHAGTGDVEVIEDYLGRKWFPSVVAFLYVHRTYN